MKYPSFFLWGMVVITGLSQPLWAQEFEEYPLEFGLFGNCSVFNINLLSRTYTGTKFYTAKGDQSDIWASNLNQPVVIAPGGDVDFRAGGQIVLRAGFHVQAGGSFHAYIAPKWCEVAREEFDSQAVFDEDWNVEDKKAYGAKSLSDANNVSISGGKLNTLIEKDPYTHNGVEYDYRTGYVTSKRHFHTSNEPYGRYDVDLWSAAEDDLNTAAWLLTRIHPDDNSVPRYFDEFDVMERYPGLDDNQYNQAYHLWHGKGSKPMNHEVVGGETRSSGDFVESWRRYSLEVEPHEIRWLVDDCVVFRIPSRNNRWDYDFAERILKEPVQWIFSAAVEDDWTWLWPADKRFDINSIAIFDKLAEGETCPNSD